MGQYGRPPLATAGLLVKKIQSSLRLMMGFVRNLKKT